MAVVKGSWVEVLPHHEPDDVSSPFRFSFVYFFSFTCFTMFTAELYKFKVTQSSSQAERQCVLPLLLDQSPEVQKALGYCPKYPSR